MMLSSQSSSTYLASARWSLIALPLWRLSVGNRSLVPPLLGYRSLGRPLVVHRSHHGPSPRGRLGGHGSPSSAHGTPGRQLECPEDVRRRQIDRRPLAECGYEDDRASVAQHTQIFPREEERVHADDGVYGPGAKRKPTGVGLHEA